MHQSSTRPSIDISRAVRIVIALYIVAAFIPFARNPLATLLAYRSEAYYIYGHAHAAHRYLMRARWIDRNNHAVEDLEAFAIGTERTNPPAEVIARRAARALQTHDVLALDNYALVYFRAKDYRATIQLLQATHPIAGVWQDIEIAAQRRLALHGKPKR